MSAEQKFCPSCDGPGDDHWFDRSLCPCKGGTMHYRCCTCGYPLDGCALEPQVKERSED